MARIRDIRSLRELERIPNPELINEDDLLIIETENGETKSVKYRDLVKGIPNILCDDLMGETGPMGPTGPSGIEIVKEGHEPKEDTDVWIQEGEYPDFHKNINSYMKEFISTGENYNNANPNEVLSWSVCKKCGDFRFRPIDENGEIEPCSFCGSIEILDENPLDDCMLYFQLDNNINENTTYIRKDENIDMVDLLNQINTLYAYYAKLNSKYVSSKLDVSEIDISSDTEGGIE